MDGMGDEIDKAMEKCLEEMKRALSSTAADVLREKRAMLNLLDHCVRNTGLLERTTPWPFSVVMQPLEDMQSDLIHTFCDELLATTALCVHTVRAEKAKGQGGFTPVPFGLFHSTCAAIKGSESWPRAPAGSPEDSGHMICEVDFESACGSSLLGWLLHVLHHCMLLYGDAMQPFMPTIAKLLPLCLPLCPLQQLPLLLSSLPSLFRKHASLHSILVQHLPGIVDVCMFVLSDSNASESLHAHDQTMLVQSKALVRAACACLHMMLSLQEHTHEVLPPHWQLLCAVASAVQKFPDQQSVLHLFHRLLLMCDTPEAALSHLTQLPNDSLRALETACIPVHLVTCSTSSRQRNKSIAKEGHTRCAKRPRLDLGGHDVPAQNTGDARTVSAVDSRVLRLQRSTAVLACFCSMVHAPVEQSGHLEDLLDEWTSIVEPQSEAVCADKLTEAIWLCTRAALVICQVLLQERRCYSSCVPSVVQAFGKVAACIHKILRSPSGGSFANTEDRQRLTVAGCTFSLMTGLLASTDSGSPAVDSTAGAFVRTADFVDELRVEGKYSRAMELMLRFDVAVALMQRRLDAKMLDCFLEDFNQPDGSIEAMNVAEHAFLCALLLTFPSEPASLALPLSVLRTILCSLTSPGTPATSSAIIPPPCVQLLLAGATCHQDSLQPAKALSAKMGSWRCSATSDGELLAPACLFYVSGTVALDLRSGSTDKSGLAGSSLRTLVDAVQHHCSPPWAPLLSCFASLEQMMPARCVISHPNRQSTGAALELVRTMGRGCSGDAVRSFAAVAVATWWLLDSPARPYISGLLLQRLCEGDARITAAMADALQVVHSTSDTPLEKMLLAQPGALQQISSRLTKHSDVLQAFTSALRIDRRWLTERVAEVSIGQMCHDLDKAGLHTLAEALQTPYDHMMSRCLPLTVSTCLWEEISQAQEQQMADAERMSFLQQELADSGAGSMEVNLKAFTALQCTKMELIYYAAESMQWHGGAPQQWQQVLSGLQLLQSCASGRSPTNAKTATIREIITVETAEFFLQLMGESLEEYSSSMLVQRAGRGERDTASHACQSPAGKGQRSGMPASSAGHDKQPVTRTKPRQPLTSARTVVLLLWVMDAEACVHALHFISVLSLCMHEAFIGDVRVLAIQGMNKLVQALHSHAPNMLRQVAAQIVGHLLAVLQGNVLGQHRGSAPASPALRSLLDAEKAAATTLLHELIVNMQDVLQGNVELGEENAIAGFPPLPEDIDIPELRMVRSVLKQVQVGRNFEATVTHLAHSLQQQATQVRHAALGVLSGQLAAYPKATEELFSRTQPRIPACRISSSDDEAQADSLPGRLVNALLKCCDLARMPRRGVVMNTMFQRCASCLGQLGALHPARISIPQPGPPSLAQKPFEFLCSAMSHILRILRTAQHLMLVELCIYVLHKLMCHPVVGSREAVLQMLSQSDRELAELHSRDVDLGLRSVPTAAAASGCIIQPQLSLHRWLHRWLRQMLEHYPQGDMHSMLDVLRAAQSYDVTLMLFLLPHMLLGVIISQEPSKKGATAAPCPVHEAIVQEVLAVAQLCTTGRTLDEATADSAQPQAALHLQAFLGALDALQRWLHESKEQLATKKSTESASTDLRAQVDQMTAFCDLLYTKKDPANGASVLEMLAFASFRCGAAARALMLYEMWLRHDKKNKLKNTARNSTGAPFSHDQVSNLMHIYSSLNDADALLGVAALRQRGPTSADWIFAARKVGRWNDVESLYELESRAATAATDLATAGHQISSSMRGAVHTVQTELSRSCTVPSLSASAAEDFLRCLMLAGKYQTLLSVADSWVSGAHGTCHAMVAGAAGVAASWRLRKWAAVDRFLKVLDRNEELLSDQSRWEVVVGRSLLLCHTGQTSHALAEVNEERTLLATLLGPACLESYERAHPLIVKMHMLSDLQSVGCEGMALGAKGNKLRPMEKTREALVGAIGRAESTGVGMDAHVEMLSLLRALAGLHGLQDLVAATWKRQAKVCFASQHIQAAWAGVLEAEYAGCNDAFKLKGKLLWQAARHVEAVDVTNCGIAALEANPNDSTNGSKTLARAKLQLLSWQVSQGQGATEAVKKEFDGLLKLRPNDDKVHLEYANFLRKVYEDLRMRQLREAGIPLVNSAPERLAAPVTTSNSGKAQKAAAAQSLYFEFAPLIIREYSQVVLHGSKRVQHALPRFLTLLIEFGHDVHLLSQHKPSQQSSAASQFMLNRLKTSIGQHADLVHQAFEKWSKALPAGKLLPCLSQAVSSLAHPNTPTKQQIQNFVAAVTSKYPSRSLWLLQAVLTSDNAARRASADAVMAQVRKSANDEVKALIKSHSDLCLGMEEVINWDPRTHKGQPLNARSNIYSLKSISRSLATMNGSLTMVPTQAAFEAANTAASHASESDLDAAVTIHSVAREVQLMQSASHPKRIHIIGSDGAQYRFLAKPQDDLRRDLRVMEFAMLLNRLLEENASTRGRSMQLQTFMCTPLGDQGGLVEWVLNTQTFQGILKTTYAAHHYNLQHINPGVHKDSWESAYRLVHAEKGHTDPKALTRWMEQRLARAPAIMHKWWLAKMPEPALWLQARATFMRTTAAWSMAGHIVGLGDRHCDNLLIDTQSGMNVQIDFGHLFDSARDLPYPEVMAFRLTQNMVDSLGVYGVEGGLRTTCCAVLQVLRTNQEVIMGLLQAIVNDPFIEWTNSKAKMGRGKSSKAPAEDAAKQQAISAMASVQGKLRGVIAGGKLTPCRQMTVPAQVDFLLNECQDIEHLSRMYIGWLPFL